MNDKKLLKLLKTDPDTGMNQLIDRYAGLVFAIVRSRLSDVCDSSEVEDCVTDVFLKFKAGLKTFVPTASIKNYLAVIARNTAGTVLRNRLQTESLDDDGFFVDLPDGKDFAEEIAEKQLLELVFAEIRNLGHPDADIMIRKYYFGQRSKQIAADLNLSVSNVDTRAHRAMEKLKNKFGGQ